MPWDWDKVSVLTREFYLKDLEDQVFKESTLFYRLKKKNAVTFDSGKQIDVKVVLAPNPNATSYRDFDILPADETEAFANATLMMKHYVVTIPLAETQIAANDGENALFSLIEQETELAKSTLVDRISTDLFLDGTGNGGKNLDGLAVAVDDGTNYAVYAGINRSTYTTWRANYFGNSGTPRNPSFALLNRALSSTMTPKGAANFGVTTIALLDKIQEDIYFAKSMILSDQEAAELGHDNILFRRRPIYADYRCPTGRLYWLNDNYIKLVVHKKYNFAFGGFHPTEAQHGVIGRIYWFGNLVVTRPSGCAAVVDLSETIST